MSKSRKFAALIPIIGILITCCGTAMAQKEEEDEGEKGMYLEKPRTFFGGLVAGASLAQVDGDYFAGYHKIGFNGGGIVYARLVKHVAASMELLYAQKGSKSSGPQIVKGTVPLVIVKYGIKANYIEVPVMINYFDKRKSHLGLGVSYSRLINENNESITIDSNGVLKNVDFGTRYPFKKSDFNLIASANLHLIKGLYFNIRFQYSLSPIRDGKDLPPIQYARSNQYNNLWTVRVMYLLGK